ncbi:MAG: SDR family oxidoreductase [Alphaproteobacteria bacterium]|nr:SDR family oxidoreductase [Alphaproteobacteria bacterium]
MTSPRWRFDGRKVVITGAAGVYGRAMSRAFADAGAALCLSDVDAAGLDALARDLALPAGRLRSQVTDLTQEASIAALARHVTDDWGAPDVLINNAGLYPFAGLMETDAATWDRIMGVNVRAPFLLTQALGRAMAEKGVKGSIVMITSTAADVLRLNGVPYCVSKRALEYLMQGYAFDLGRYGIRVNAVRPGFAEGSKAVSFPPGYADVVAEANPLGRRSEPEDMVAAVMFLCSDAAASLTGQVIAADNGSAINRRQAAATQSKPLAATRR